MKNSSALAVIKLCWYVHLRPGGRKLLCQSRGTGKEIRIASSTVIPTRSTA